MKLEVTPEVLLSQFGYSKNDSSLRQAEKIIEVTKDFDKFAKHILTLNDHLKVLNAYVAFSNKTDYLKIKCENESEDVIEEFHDIVWKWAKKYKVDVERLNKKPIYYIIGSDN